MMTLQERLEYITRAKRKLAIKIKRQDRRVILLVFISIYCNFFILTTINIQPAKCQLQQEPFRQPASPQPIPGASHVALNGLALIIMFDKPVNLSSAIESVEQRLAASATAYDSSTSESNPRMAAEQSVRAEVSRQRLPANQYQEPTMSQLSRQMNKNKGTSRVSFVSEQINLSKKSNKPDYLKKQEKASKRLSLDELLQAAATNSNNQQQLFYTCQREEDQLLTTQLIGGIQLCAQILSRKTLRQLRNLKLFNCVWASQVQFIIQLGRPLSSSNVRVAFARNSIRDSLGRANERELSLELSKLPLEGISSLGSAGGGVSSQASGQASQLAPRLALTGPNQVPACGQFALSAHLSSPYGTRPGESILLEWSVERNGLVQLPNNQSGSNFPQQRPPMTVPPIALAATPSSSSPDTSQTQTAAEVKEARWLALKSYVAQQKSNNLVLDSALLEYSPQSYEFKLSVTFVSSLTQFKLNFSHQVTRLDFDTPIGSIYGTHMLSIPAPSSASVNQNDLVASGQQQLNTNQELALVADIQVPECAQNIKQVGLYWQVSDPRVRFEQTYSPFYVAKSNSLPEQALVEFRINLFYGIRVKKFASASALISTGDSILDSQISDGLLMSSVGQDATAAPNEQQQLKLHADNQSKWSSPEQQASKYTYQWSCFDGRTAQACSKSAKSLLSNSSTTLNRYESQSSSLLVDKARSRQPTLKLPLAWLESDAQLWFGLQRFDRQNPSQHSKTEYALVSVQPLDVRSSLSHSSDASHQQYWLGRQKLETKQPPSVSIGPVLVGQQATRGKNNQFRATLRNPLSGAIILLENVPSIVVGRIRPSSKLEAFSWRVPNYAHPLHWTVRNGSASNNDDDDELITELHLNPELLVAHSNHQVQLVACWNEQIGAQSSIASIGLDIIQGVGECRVELMPDLLPTNRSPNVQIPLTDPTVSVNYCNIPLGLSPLTYQLYLIDTSSIDSLVENSRSGSSNKTSSGNDESEYLNEADELYLESQAQPIGIPQLSPVFLLGSLATSAMQALVSSVQFPPANASLSITDYNNNSVHVRFAARVCHRLSPSCRMFYSSSINVFQLMAKLQQAKLSAASSLAQVARPAPSSESQQQAESMQSLRKMLANARRANVAGNSIAAITIVGSVMQLADRMLPSSKQPSGLTTDTSNNVSSDPSIATTTTTKSTEQIEQRQAMEQQTKELFQLATRDCLQYASQSLQRQFHYTEAGQTNVVLMALGKVLQHRHSSLESKFRAMRLISMLVARKLNEQMLSTNQKLSSPLLSLSLPDFKTIQVTFEHLFSPTVFVQHSLGGDHSASNQRGGSHQPSSARLLSGGQQSSLRSNSSLLAAQQQQQQLASLLAAASISNAAEKPTISSSYKSSSSNRRKREEAILVYLRAIRQAHRALLQAVAVQLPLGSVQQFEYQQTKEMHQQQQQPNSMLGGFINGGGGADEATTDESSNRVSIQQNAPTTAGLQQTPVDIVSSLTRQINLMSDNIDVDLREFGSVSITFDGGASSSSSSSSSQVDNKQSGTTTNILGNKLALQLARAGLRCKNATINNKVEYLSPSSSSLCSSFVLALTSFSGRAPFRALNVRSARSAPETNSAQPQSQSQMLGAPIIQLDWLSPIDGSNLIDLLRQDQEKRLSDDESTLESSAGSLAAQEKPLKSDDFKASVTFTIPLAAKEELQQDGSSQQQQASEDSSRRNFRCFQFDETANEWVETQQLAIDDSNKRNAVDIEPESASAEQSRQRPASTLTIRCSYSGYGALSIFQGRPPVAERPLELSIMLGLGGLLVIVAGLSFLGCFASSSKEKRANASLSSDSATATTSGSESTASSLNSHRDSYDGIRRQQQQRVVPPHFS